MFSSFISQVTLYYSVYTPLEDADALCMNATLPHNSTCSWSGFEDLEVMEITDNLFLMITFK